MLKRPPFSPDRGRSSTGIPADELPGTCTCFGVPPRSLDAMLWQILPQLTIGGAVLLVSCVAGGGP